MVCLERPWQDFEYNLELLLWRRLQQQGRKLRHNHEALLNLRVSMKSSSVDVLKLFFIPMIFGVHIAGNVHGLEFKKNPAPDDHRCGVCPTYIQKICGFDFDTNATFIFDNHCVMDLYNCIHGTEFINQNYENCLYFGNFAYVHGFKYEDYDYGEDHVIIKDTKKNPDFVK